MSASASREKLEGTAPGSTLSEEVSSGAQLASFVEERAILLHRLEALEEDRHLGLIDEEEFASLRSSLVGRTAAVLREITRAASSAGEEAREAPAASRARRGDSRFSRARRTLGRRRSQRILVALAAISFLGLAVVLVSALAGFRLPGETISGTITLNKSEQIEEQLAQASELGTEGKVVEAIDLYNEVLVESPRQPEALTYRGWLERLIGLQAGDNKLVRSGDLSVERATMVAPHYPDAHALFGVILLEDRHDLAGAISQFRDFLAEHPGHSLLAFLRPSIEAAFKADHLVVPAVVRAA